MRDRNNKPPSEPVDRHAAQRNAREERLAKALRANLKRRKAAARTTLDTEPDGAGDEPEPRES